MDCIAVQTLNTCLLTSISLIFLTVRCFAVCQSQQWKKWLKMSSEEMGSNHLEGLSYSLPRLHVG